MSYLKGSDIIEITFRKSKSRSFETALLIAQKIKSYRSEKAENNATIHVVHFEPALVDKKTLDKIENLLEIIRYWTSAFVTINGREYEAGIYEFYESEFAELSLLRGDRSKNIRTSKEIAEMLKNKLTSS